MKITGSNAPTRTNAHSRSIGNEIDDILRALVQVLGNKVVATIVGKDVRTVQRWLAAKSTAIGLDDEKMLRDAFQIYSLLATLDGDHTIRAWFMGMNPSLNDRSPIEVLAEGRARLVVAAARTFVNGA